ncbi:MAG TPA: endo-1,4-beta-xylanase [Terriglobales bacterium]
MRLHTATGLKAAMALSQGNARSLLLAALIGAVALASAQQPTLKDAYNGCFLVGAALNPSQFTGENARQAALIKAQFDTISPENVLKWERVHPQPDKYNFGPSDQYVDFGQQNHMFIIGHTLIWHSQTPKWVFEDANGNPVSRKVLLKRMRDHIQTVVGRYKGRVNGWDVVNEVVSDDGTMRQSPWMKIIGPDYIEKAFEYAHKADPKAQLYYNDYSLENDVKRKGALELVRKLRAKHVPITGVGLQDHVSLDWPTTQQINATIDGFGKLGMKVMITELDVDVLPWPTPQQTADVSLRVASNPQLNPYRDGLPDAVQQQLANRYADLFRAYASHCGVVTRVTFWGVNDGDSWKNGWPVRGRTNYPLLFDRNDQPKPAFNAVIEAAPKKQ